MLIYRILSSVSKQYGTTSAEKKSDDSIEPPILDVDKLKTEMETLSKEINTIKDKNNELMVRYNLLALKSNNFY